MPRGWTSSRLYTLLDAAVAGARVEDFGCAVPGLIEAQRGGLPVAETWVVGAGAFRSALERLPPGHDPASLIRAIHKPSGLERTARARDRMRELALPDELSADLAKLAAEHGSSGFGLTLRASPTLHDATLSVAAGLDEVMHGLRDAEALERAVAAAWALLFDERALSYLRERKLRDVAMAVVLQRMPEVTASFVVQQGDPTDERRTQHIRPDAHLVSASLGLGSPVRDGAAAHDVLRVGADGSVLARLLADKREALVVGHDGLTAVLSEPDRAEQCALDDASLARATAWVRKLDVFEPHELDLVAARDGTLSIVAVRRATGQGSPDGGALGTVWSRSGIADLLPASPTPLTASIVERFCESSLRGALDSLGADVPKAERLIGRVHGRYYLNVSALVPAVSGVPGVDPAVVLELLRGADPTRLARAVEVPRARRSLSALAFAAGRFLLHERKLMDSVARFERDAEQHRRWLAEMDLAILPDDSLVTTLRQSGAFVETTGRLLLQSSIIALAGHLALEAALSRVVSENARRLAQSLSSGIADLESARASLALAHVVEILRSDAAGRAAVLAGEGSLEALPAGPGQRALESWLEGFGERGLSETEALSPRFAEEPSAVFAMLRAGLVAPVCDPDRLMSRVRSNADSDLASLERQASGLELALVRALLGRARTFARLRERMRVWMARTMGMLRTVTADVDRRLRRLDPSLERDAAFFLTEAELLHATSRTRADLGPLVRMRRASHERELSRPDPPDTFVGLPSRLAAPSFDGRVLTGARTSSGVVTGRVHHVSSSGAGAESVEAGDVIVLRIPDPGLAALFFWSGGVVADAGSALSHAAVLAREIGTPAVFGVVNAWATLRDGERVRVDGDRGIVERLDA